MTMDRERLAELEKIAREATEGPWSVRPEREYDRASVRHVGANINALGESVRFDGDVKNGGVWVAETKGPDCIQNAAFLSAFDPPTALALLSDLTAMREENERLTREVAKLRRIMSTPTTGA